MPLTDTHTRNVNYAGKPKKHFDGGGLFLCVTAMATNSGVWLTALTKGKMLGLWRIPCRKGSARSMLNLRKMLNPHCNAALRNFFH